MQFDQLKRRWFITLLGAAAAGPIGAGAQERVRRIGVLMNVAEDDAEGKARLAAFLQGYMKPVGSSAAMCGSTSAGQPAISSSIPDMRWNCLRSRRTSFWPRVLLLFGRCKRLLEQCRLCLQVPPIRSVLG